MKKYRVTVNGTVYEVELEELTGAAPAASAAAVAMRASVIWWLPMQGRVILSHLMPFFTTVKEVLSSPVSISAAK